MKLFYNQASPFARKVMVSAMELGIADRIEADPQTLSPVDPNAAIIAASALGKIPTLVMDDGSALFDSRAICEYLDSLATTTKIFPASGPARWAALRMAALGDGICDTGVGVRYETLLRPKELQWPDLVAAQRARMTRSFQEIEDRYIGDLAGVDIGSIAIACALGYMDFRFPDIGWRDGRPRLTAWYETFVKRPSMTATMPPKA